MWESKAEGMLRFLFALSDRTSDTLFELIKNDKVLRKHIDRKVKDKEEKFESIFKFREPFKETKRSLWTEHIVTREIFRNLFSREEAEKDVRRAISTEFLKLSIHAMGRIVSQLHPGRESDFIESLVSASGEMVERELGDYGGLFQEGFGIILENGRELYTRSRLEEGEILNDTVIRRFCDSIATMLGVKRPKKLYGLLAPGIARAWRRLVENHDFLRRMGLVYPDE